MIAKKFNGRLIQIIVFFLFFCTKFLKGKREIIFGKCENSYLKMLLSGTVIKRKMNNDFKQNCSLSRINLNKLVPEYY